MRVAGAILIVFGFLLSLTIIGAFIGIPFMLIGAVLLVFGGRKTVITNVVTVQNAPASYAPERPTKPIDESNSPRLAASNVAGELPRAASAPIGEREDR